MISLVLLLLAGQLNVERKLDQIDRTFVCPESLPSDQARQDAMSLFVAQVKDVEPDLSIKQLIEYRQTLLVRHRCNKTLQNTAKKR